MNWFIEMGAIAMTGFFLLSGYAINLSSTKRNMTDSKEINKFYIKRLISILPLYYTWALINIGINIVMKGFSGGGTQELILFPIETLGIQAVFATLFPFSHNSGSWFISCILLCYLVFPLLHMLTKDLNDKSRTVLIVILSAILLYSPFVTHYFHIQGIYSNPFFRILEFTISMLVCQMNMIRETQNKLIILMRKPIICVFSIIALISGVSIVHYHGVADDYMIYSWIALPCFISLLVSLGYLELKELQKSRTIRYLSALSFSIFLSQIIAVWYSVKFALGYIGCDSNVVQILISATICFCIANFFHFCIEKPSSEFLKNKFLK